MKKTMIFIIVVAITVGIFGCGTDKKSNGTVTEQIDVSSDTTDLIIPEEQVVSGGTSQEMVDSFSGEASAAVMTVNGEPVDPGAFAFVANDFASKYAQSLVLMGAVPDVEKFKWTDKDPNFDGTYQDYVKFSSVEDIVPRYALLAEGKRRGVTLSDEDKQGVQEWVKSVQGSASDKEFEKNLAAVGCPGIGALKAFREISVLEAKIYEDFRNNPEKYATREQLLAADERELVTVKHILISFDPENTGAPVTDEMKTEARARAEEVLAKVNEGQDFDALIEEYNDDPGATEEGYTFADDGTMVPEFAAASFALEIGKTSGLVETSYGYHIIKRLDRAVSITDYIVLLNKNAKVKINSSIFDKIGITVDMKVIIESLMQNMPAN